jgi:CRISPR-associated protein Cas6
MYWEDNSAKTTKVVSDDVVDVAFGISCRVLPVDHAYSLSNAIRKELTWLDDEPYAAVHTIHVATSGNGWYRPDSSEQMLHPSRRTKLKLRIPKHRIDDVKSLTGKTLDIDGNALTIKEMTHKSLSDITTVFSRYIVVEGAKDEMEFLNEIVESLKEMGIKPKKMLCGKEDKLRTDDGELTTRSLMIADLTFEESLLLQQQGLGSHRLMGCGIFLPHKDINEIGETMG